MGNTRDERRVKLLPGESSMTLRTYLSIIFLMPVSLYTSPSTLTLSIPATNIQLDAPAIDNLTSSINGLINTVSATKPSGIGTLALAVGLYSAWGLFSKYPAKAPAERTRSDWAIPAAGLTASAGTLLYLWSLQINK